MTLLMPRIWLRLFMSLANETPVPRSAERETAMATEPGPIRGPAAARRADRSAADISVDWPTRSL